MAVTSSFGTVRHADRPRTGRKRNHQRKTQGRPDPVHRPAFLAQAHHPLLAGEREELKDRTGIQKAFFRSAKNLCNLYGLKIEKPVAPFPFNITIALEQLKNETCFISNDIEIMVLQDIQHLATLATVKVFDTRSTLYYIPLAPMWAMMQKKENRKSVNLLTSVMAYLSQVVEIAHFAENFSYLAGQYEMIMEWATDYGEDIDISEKEHFAKHYHMINEAGLCMLMLFSDSKHLKFLKSRVKNYRPANPLEKRLRGIAKMAFELYRDYPCRSIMENMTEFSADEYDEGVVLPEQYLHFYWSAGDCFADQIIENVNAELNECAKMQEPQSMQLFDQPQKNEMLGHDFEERLFALLNQLIDYLNDL